MRWTTNDPDEWAGNQGAAGRGLDPGGHDRQGCYIAVIDEGSGPSAALEELIALGASDKPGHTGFGLETARTAISSMDGDLMLERNRRGGATAILRWPGRP